MNLNQQVYNLSGIHVRFFGINILGCVFCRLCGGCSGFGACNEVEVPSVPAGLLLPGTGVSSIGR